MNTTEAKTTITMEDLKDFTLDVRSYQDEEGYHLFEKIVSMIQESMNKAFASTNEEDEQETIISIYEEYESGSMNGEFNSKKSREYFPYCCLSGLKKYLEDYSPCDYTYIFEIDEEKQSYKISANFHYLHSCYSSMEIGISSLY